MKEKSIYEYIQENVAPNGKICPDCTMKEYISRVYNREYEADIYNSFCKLSMWDVNVDNSIEKVEFKIYLVVERLLDSLDSSEIEKYLKDKELNIRLVIDQIIEKIEKKIESIDKLKLAKFCKKNILKTKNMHCMYIYLLLASYTDLKGNDNLQNIILKIGLLPEYTLFLNQYILDKFSYPEYSRFYLVKRIDWQSKYISSLLEKISFENDEIKYWALENYTSKNSDEGIKDVIWNLDIVKLLNNEDLDSKTYKNIGYTLRNVLGKQYAMKNPDYLAKLLLEYIRKHDEFVDNFDYFWPTSEIYISICRSEYFSPDVKQNLVNEYKKVLNTNETIAIIKEELNNPNNSDELKFDIYEIISALNITELYLGLFNSFKKNPVENASWLKLFEYNREIHKQAINILYEAIDWDNIIGEYSTLRRHSFKPDPVKFLIYSAQDYAEIAYKVYAKTLRSKKLEHRYITAMSLHSVLYREGTMYELLPKELRESMQYHYEHELDIKCKSIMALILGIYDEDDDEIKSEVANKLRVIRKSDDEFLEEERKDKIEYEEYNRINLNGYILSKLDMYIGEIGVNTYLSKKVIYFKRIKNDVTAWCQGEEFGKEYVVRLKGDENAYLVEATCTCGKNDPKDKNHYCKHVAATLIYQSKLNDGNRKVYF